MGFSNQERINLLTKALAAGVIDANAVSAWYETFFPNRFISESTSVWLELTTLRDFPAANIATAQANALEPELATILSDLSDSADAVRLTEVTGTNGTTWAAYSTYGDTTSAVLNNWLLPALVPQSSGMPSNGYAIRLFEGDPAAGGTEITTSDGTTGSGDEKTVGWIWNYSSGLLLLSDDFKDSVTNPYVLGFRYVGRTVDDLESDMTGIQSDVSTLQSDMTTAQSDISTLQDDVDTLQDEVDALQQSANGMTVRFVRGG